MNDCIDRQMLINLLTSRAETLKGLYGDLGGAASGIKKLVQTLPSIEPTERTAKVDCKRYIGTSAGIVGEIKVTGICENCHNAVVDRYSFCPSCGVRLEWK